MRFSGWVVVLGLTLIQMLIEVSVCTSQDSSGVCLQSNPSHTHRCWTAALSARERGMSERRLKGAEKRTGQVRTPRGHRSDLWKFHLESPGTRGATARMNSLSVLVTQTRSRRRRLNGTRKRPIKAKLRDDYSRMENWRWETLASRSTSPSHRSAHITCQLSVMWPSINWPMADKCFLIIWVLRGCWEMDTYWTHQPASDSSLISLLVQTSSLLCLCSY